MEQSTGNCNAIRQLSKDKPIFLTLFRGSESIEEVITMGSHAHGQTPIEITMVVLLLLTLDVKLGKNSIPPEHRLLLGAVSLGRSKREENTDSTEGKNQF